MSDLYRTLGVSRDADGSAIKAGYRALAKQAHPDVNPGSTTADRRTKEINSAYEVLGDPGSRAAYDLELTRLGAERRQGFWRGTATGVAAFALTLSIGFALVVWRKTTPTLPSQSEDMTRQADARSSITNSPVTAPDSLDSEQHQQSEMGPGRRVPKSSPLARATEHTPAKPHHDHILETDSPPHETASASLPSTDAHAESKTAVAPTPERMLPRNTKGDVAGERPGVSADLQGQAGAHPHSPPVLHSERASVVAESGNAVSPDGSKKPSKTLEIMTDQRHVREEKTTVSALARLPERTGNSLSWMLHRDVRFGFAIKYPADIFETIDPNSSRGVHALISQDGRASLRIFSMSNTAKQTISAYRRSLMEARYAEAVFDYSPLRSSWFVLSGTNGTNMFYERVTFSCDGRAIHGWQLVYLVTERVIYDAIIEEMHRSYRHDNGPGARCGEPRSFRGRLFG
jgi:hypothetical protein